MIHSITPSIIHSIIQNNDCSVNSGYSQSRFEFHGKFLLFQCNYITANKCSCKRLEQSHRDRDLSEPKRTQKYLKDKTRLWIYMFIQLQSNLQSKLMTFLFEKGQYRRLWILITTILGDLKWPISRHFLNWPIKISTFKHLKRNKCEKRWRFYKMVHRLWFLRYILINYVLFKIIHFFFTMTSRAKWFSKESRFWK